MKHTKKKKKTLRDISIRAVDFNNCFRRNNKKKKIESNSNPVINLGISFSVFLKITLTTAPNISWCIRNTCLIFLQLSDWNVNTLVPNRNMEKKKPKQANVIKWPRTFSPWRSPPWWTPSTQSFPVNESIRRGIMRTLSPSSHQSENNSTHRRSNGHTGDPTCGGGMHSDLWPLGRPEGWPWLRQFRESREAQQCRLTSCLSCP